MTKAKATKPAAELPPLPASVFSIAGPVPVVLVENLKARDGGDVLGLWVPEERCIKLCAGVSPVTQHITLLHEVIHVASWDSGIGLSEEQEERMCDALSSFLFAAGVRL